MLLSHLRECSEFCEFLIIHAVCVFCVYEQCVMDSEKTMLSELTFYAWTESDINIDYCVDYAFHVYINK